MGAIIWLAGTSRHQWDDSSRIQCEQLGWLFFWLAGSVVTVSQRVAVPERGLADLELQPAP
jgi:hypothetical protein